MSMKEKRPMGMYVHIPFCSRKCDYCDFVSYSMDEEAQKAYLDALFIEIDNVKSNFYKETFDTLYIGGGTPSIVFPGFIYELTRKLFSSFHFADKAEITIEINPESFTKNKLLEYIDAGINRISVGVQCVDTKLLADQGRIQSMKNIDNTFEILKEGGFDNVSGDVLIGLPKQSIEAILDTIYYLVDNKVRHISTYTLQVEKHTMLYDKIKRGKVKLPKDSKVVEMYNVINKVLTEEGYIRYEVSNYARPGYKSQHNQKYWDEVNYLGLGCSAHSFIDGYRYHNTNRLDNYIADLNEGKKPIFVKEYVPKEDKRIERLMLSLRTVQGLDLNKFELDFNENILLSKAEPIKKLKDQGLIIIEDSHLKIAPHAFNVANAIIVELM